MKIFLNNPRESWIVDRIREEWFENNPGISTEKIEECDVLWIVAPWLWNQIPQQYLTTKKVVCTIHHIVPGKFSKNKIAEFLIRDKFVDAYHVPNKYTESIVRKLTAKPIFVISYWLNTNLWQPTDKTDARRELGVPTDKFVIGSFQRDTEGSDLISPKLEKGPDLFCDYVEKIANDDTLVLLGGWRRQYVISRLEAAKINYLYLEQQSILNVRKMYGACDLYVVSSRHEGGPQALFEAASMRVPIISNPVGLASEVLCENCVFDLTAGEYFPSEEDVEENFNKASEYDILTHKQKYINMFKEVCGVS